MRLETACGAGVVPWDYALSTKEKKRKEKEMKLDSSWDSRVTQEMVDGFVDSPESPAATSSAGRKRDLRETFVRFPNCRLGPPPRSNPQEIAVD